MGPEGAVKLYFEKKSMPQMTRRAAAVERTRQYREEFANPYLAASRGYLDDVIVPEQSRTRLIQALDSLREKRQDTPSRKHGNIPL